jgi:membrane-associated phospholipid phosphatase
MSSEKPLSPVLSRRRLFQVAAGASALAAFGEAAPRATKHSKKAATAVSARQREVMRIRVAAAEHACSLGFPTHARNGDEKLDPRWAAFSKGLPHDASGEADGAAMHALLDAIESRDPERFERVPLGGYVKLANPQASFAYDLLGPDSHQPTIAPPPSFSSAAQAAEMAEMYWHAFTRDVPFAEWPANPLIAEGVRELTQMSGYSGPRADGKVTAETIFRGSSRGSRIGPYVSQFLWRDLPWTPIRVQQLIRVAAPNKNYLTSAADFLAIQNGAVFPVNDYDTKPRYITTPRDLCEYVHRDFTYQAALGACLMLFRMSAPLDGGLPYQYSISQSGFVTFGPSDITHLVAIVSNVALKASWYQKWVVHRRLRPEEYGARIHFHSTGARRYPFHSDLFSSSAPERAASMYGTRLLPQSYPEGAPLHPSYPAGHAVVAGACATALKACFAENFVIPNPSVPAADGLHLEPYRGPELTVGHELDKLAENIAFARNFAGIHWRSDAVEGLKFGEAIAIEVLREMKMTGRELFDGFDLTTFAGQRLTI